MNIPIPGIMFECGSNRDGRHGLRGELTHSQKGPRWFRLNRIDPMLEGNPAVFLHRWFGEYTRGDHQDFHAVTQLKNGEPVDRDYAHAAMREIQLLAQQCEVFMYMGSFKIGFFSNILRRLGHTAWFDAVMNELDEYSVNKKPTDIKWNRYLGKVGGSFNFVFDHASTYNKRSFEFAALNIISRYELNKKAHIEATPLPENYSDEKYPPSFVNEVRYQQTTQRITPRMIKAGVTRWLNKSALESVWNGYAVDFVLDCHDKGHKCFIADTVYNHIDLTPKKLQELAEEDL